SAVLTTVQQWLQEWSVLEKQYGSVNEFIQDSRTIPCLVFNYLHNGGEKHKSNFPVRLRYTREFMAEETE
ncbi:hypothetical protein NQZ68_008346, partial [Dissostichus eleginoides]